MTTNTLEMLVSHLRALIDGPGRAVEATVLRDGWKAALPQLHALRGEVKRIGAWAPHLAPEHGGLGLTLVEFARVSEELGRSPIGHWLCNCQAPDVTHHR